MPQPHLELARSLSPWALAFGTCLFAQGAAAAPVATTELKAPYGVRADPRPIPPGVLAAPDPEPLLGTAKSNVFFLNYDGVTIGFTGQEDDSSQNISQFQEFQMAYAPYGDGAKRAASTQAVKADWAKYQVVITETRPGNGNYTMCVNSPTNPYGGGVLGIAPLDCDDNQARNIVFAYHSANDEYPAATQATTMSQEIAHAFGLEHVKEPTDIMNPYNGGGDPAFLDQCFTLDAGGGQILCTNQHNQFCNGGQNSHQELSALFGQAAPDVAPPTVNISFPTDGQIFDAGASFSVTAEAGDDVGVVSVEIFINGGSTIVDAAPPYAQPLQGIPAGTYTTHAIASDQSGNVTQSATVTFTVVEGATTDPTTDPTNVTTDPTTATTASTASTDPDITGTSGGGTGTGEDSTPTEGGGDEFGDETANGGESGGLPPPFESGPALPPGYGQADEGDSCSVTPQPVPSGSLLVLALALIGRRRRRAA